MAPGGLWSELRRRNVFKVATAYLVVSWLLMQVASILFPALHLPDWSVTLLVALLAIGLVPVLIFSWVYELTPEGLKRESEIDPARSITGETGQKLNLITIGLLAIAICVVIIDRLLLDQPQPATQEVVTEPYAEPALPAPTTEAEAVPFLAVLPFKATGSDDGGFLAGGLHDDLLIRLAKLGAFKVISRTSMMEYKDTTKNMRQIGEELGAGYILEGSVQSLNNRVHINAQLIDAREDEHLWADSYDRELTATNLFEIQAELAEAIARQLRTTLSESAQDLISDIPTRSTEAYKAYIRGLGLLEKPLSERNQEELERALEEAVRLDPNFALAWARLTQAWLKRAFTSPDPSEKAASRASALAALQKAEALAPDLLETKLAQIDYLWEIESYAEALQLMEDLSTIDTLSAEALSNIGKIYFQYGLYEKGYQSLLEARRLSPRNIEVLKRLAWAATAKGDCASANSHVYAALLVAPTNEMVRSATALYEIVCNGDADRADALLRNIELSQPGSMYWARLAARAKRDYQRLLELTQVPMRGPYITVPLWDLIERYEALIHLDRIEEANHTLDTVGEELREVDNNVQYVNKPWYALAKARYYSLRGDKKNTLLWLERDNAYWDRRKEYRATEKFAALVDRIVILTTVGLDDHALNELQAVFEQQNPIKFMIFRAIDLLPWFDNLRVHPRYIDLREKYGPSQ